MGRIRISRFDPLIEGDPGRGLTPSQVPATLSFASETYTPSASALGVFLWRN
jgi:hypothetical protein